LNPRHALKRGEVLFSGYKVPHPLEHRIILKLQTTKESTPTRTLTEVTGGLKSQLDVLESKFADQVRTFRPGDVAMRYA